MLRLLARKRGADYARSLALDTTGDDVLMESGQMRAVVTPDEVIEADRVVLACGSWSPQVVRRLKLRLPLQPGKGYHLDIDRPTLTPSRPVVLVEERIFVTPLDELLRLAGTMEFSGFNLTQRSARIEQLSRGAEKYIEGVKHATVRSRWCHLRPMTSDGLPIIDRIPHLDNVWIATGHGMLGITQGPITGKLVAEWITEGKPSIDLNALRVGRF